MATLEFYIRNETDPEARGPFSHEQLYSLAESGEVTAGTVSFDATADTKDKADPAEALARAAKVGMGVATAILLLSATGLLLPLADRTAAGDGAALLTHPLASLGVVDFVLFVLLALGVVAIEPFIRFWATLGLGFLGFVFWTPGAMLPFAAVVAGSAGLYLCMVFTRFALRGIASLLGLAGTGTVTYCLVN